MHLILKLQAFILCTMKYKFLMGLCANETVHQELLYLCCHKTLVSFLLSRSSILEYEATFASVLRFPSAYYSTYVDNPSQNSQDSSLHKVSYSYEKLHGLFQQKGHPPHNASKFACESLVIAWFPLCIAVLRLGCHPKLVAELETLR